MSQRSTTIISNKSLARIIEADLLREPERKPTRQVMGCLTCGRPFVYKIPSGEDCGRFCSVRCQEDFDAGAPAWDEPREKNLHLWTSPLQGCRAIAGNPWQSVIDASERKRRKLEKRKNRRNKATRSMAYKGGDLRIGPYPRS